MNDKQLHAAFFMDGDTDDKIPQKLFNFLQDFDPVELKYSTEAYSVFPVSKEKMVPFHLRDKLIQYDSIFQLSTLNKEPYSEISDNLRLVYGSAQVVENDIKVFNLTEKRMISQYLGIPQLEKMFDEDYFNFEWDMHIAQNYHEHRNDYQRDHFIHQIRDMYSMLVLLGNHGFYEASLKNLNNRSTSKISLYTQKKLTEFTCNRRGVYSTLEAVYPELKEEVMHNPKWSHDANIQKKYDKADSYIRNYFMKYVIYASSILSALFHDMGYPICHFLNVRNRTSEYNPTLYMYTRNEVESFDHIASLLSSSLLFTILSREEIKRSMMPKSSGKYDHGAYSAIAFLLQFYNSGIIFSLSEEKQCAIELAAVAIYNHTLEYKIAKEETKKYFYQPIFKQNPISFMLRLCDDLQEWGRRYYVISNESDVPVCSKCLTPSIFRYTPDKVQYRCLCSEKASRRPFNSFRYKNFYNRKLYLVSTSDYMTSYVIKVEGGKKALCFHIQYDYYKLLNVTRINHTYAKYRLSELNDLKKLLKSQDFKSDFGFDYIFLDYFMTANPITIKLKILERFIAILKGKTRLDSADINSVSLSNITRKLKFTKGIKFRNSALQQLLNNGVFEFYKLLLKEVIALRNQFKGRKVDYSIVKNAASDFINVHINAEKNYSEYYKQIMSNLLSDTFEQYSKEIVIEKQKDGDITEAFSETDKYDSQYAPNKEIEDKAKKTEDALYNSIRAYCNSENDFNRYTNPNVTSDPINYLSYFSDLYFFEEMNRVIQKNDLSEFIT